MKYRKDDRSGNLLSVLGYGCMRFPRTLGRIDMAKSEQLILEAVDKGINYFDTAYIYMGSEEVLGTILHKHQLRTKVFVATKLPHGRCRTYEDFDQLLHEQLTHLKTDYIDYYLIHNIGDLKSWERLTALGIEAWIKQQKEKGTIRQIGFSFHGPQAEFMALLAAYDWDFCQIQYNYMNTNYQAGTAGLKAAAAKNIPVIIMEPLLGGKLATGVPKKALERFKEADSNASPASWGLRWLWNQPEVTVVLSGMNQKEQLDDNLKTADNAAANQFTQEHEQLFQQVTEIFEEAYKVPCTGCNYCMPCPHHVNIPGCFTAYNMCSAVGWFSGIQQYAIGANILQPAKSRGAGKCRRCGQCEKKCPQHIPIMDSLTDVKKKLEPFWLMSIIKVFNKIRRA